MRTLALALALAVSAGAANWTDRKEYDLALNLRAEVSAQKRIALLNQWKSAYPRSEFAAVRLELLLSAYQSLGDGPHTLGAAGDLLAAQPDNLVGAYWFTLLLPEAPAAAPEQLALGEKAAARLLAGGAPSAAANELIAHRALGWIDWQRSEFAPAEEEFRKCLLLDANAAEISAWLGTVLALEQQPEKRVPALWQLARAAAYRDAGALSDGLRRQYGELLERLYTSYHGDTGGLELLRASAIASLYPPDQFDIETAAAAALRQQDEALTRINPQLAAWVRIRQKLESPEGDRYFADTLHNTALPRLKGTLVAAEPKGKPDQLTIAVLDPSQAEIVLQLATALPNDADPGTALEFEGTADAVAKSPFRLTLLADPSKLSGWPAAPAPPPPPAHPVRKPVHK
jgi:hypothetical protein